MSVSLPADPLSTFGVPRTGLPLELTSGSAARANLLALRPGQEALPFARASRDSDPAAVREAATMLEGHFLTMLLGQMRESMVLNDEDEEGWFHRSRAEEMFTDQLDEALGEELAQRHQVGIADLIVRQLLPPEPTT